MNNYHILYFSLMYFLIGMIHTFVGAFNQYLKVTVHMDETTVSNLIIIQFFCFMVGVIYSITSSNKNLKPIFKMIHIFILIVIFMFITFEHSITLYLIVSVLGFSAGFIESAIASYIFNNQFKSAAYFGYIESFFALGALLFPFITHMFDMYSNTKNSILFILVINIFSCLVLCLLDLKQRKINTTKPLIIIKKKVSVFIVLVWCFFYIGIETNFSNLLPYINLVSDTFSYVTVSIFWIGIIIGRYIYIIILSRIKCHLETLLFIYTIISLLLYLVLIYIETSDQVKLIFLFSLSMFFAPMFPLGASIINKYGSNKNLLTSIFIALAGLGGAMGSVMIRTATLINISVTTSILLLLITCLFFSIIIAKYKNINTPPNKQP